MHFVAQFELRKQFSFVKGSLTFRRNIFPDSQENVDASLGETVTLITELPESGLEVTWLKDDTPLSISDGKYETINRDCSYELVIADVKVEECGEYKVQGEGYESSVLLNVNGWSHN